MMSLGVASQQPPPLPSSAFEIASASSSAQTVTEWVTCHTVMSVPRSAAPALAASNQVIRTCLHLHVVQVDHLCHGTLAGGVPCADVPRLRSPYGLTQGIRGLAHVANHRPIGFLGDPSV